MTSIEYCMETGEFHCNVFRKITNYIKRLNKVGIDVKEYFIKDSYPIGEGKPRQIYIIKEKGEKLLKANPDARLAGTYCRKCIEFTEEDIFPEWVYMNLKAYGNCSIELEDIKKHGEAKIIENLKKRGYNCRIRTHDALLYSSKFENLPTQRMWFYILETIKEEKENENDLS